MNYILRLYITGQTPNSIRAIENMEKICKNELKSKYQLEIIDILKNPQLAEDDKIIATPTVVKMLPPPINKIIGDLSDKEKVVLGLDLINGKE